MTSEKPSLPAGSPGSAPDAPPTAPGLRREKAALDALRTLIRDLHLERFGAPPPAVAELPLNLSLHVRPPDNWALRFDPPLADQVHAQLANALAGRGGYREGQVYCFRCETTDCEHGAPPSPLAVFSGYTATGVPQWQDLTQIFVDAKDSRVDRLFLSPPHPLTRIELGHALRVRQLSSFGKASRTYAILGQVVAGYFLLPRAYGLDEPDSRLAFTFQAIESRDLEGRILVRLNILARLPAPHTVDELLVSDWHPWIQRALGIAKQHLEGIERQVNAAQAEGQTDKRHQVMRRIPAVLKQLAASLERGHRQGQRRTQHVETRRHAQRPVHKALDDTRAAAPAAIFLDEKTDTLAVCGAQGRAHIFNRSGRHVTSFMLRPDSVAFRLRTRRWRPATAEEIAGLHQALAASTANDPSPAGKQ
jgi:hypothetical protein